MNIFIFIFIFINYIKIGKNKSDSWRNKQENLRVILNKSINDRGIKAFEFDVIQMKKKVKIFFF